ncbi:hypothetical protein CC2G_012172 [Coprinopsis cinerea AmutBmut pab1-1]|nr:hypothetical protein CC2G_012172 [Coprinopsis cinerea AmutBmut pab1-1]
MFDPRREAYREFNRMLRWRKEAFPELRLALSENAKEDRKAWLATFRRALIEHFHWRYGTDVESLPAWQGLCETVGVVPVPGELKAAREAVCNAHVNLVDLTTKYTAFTDDEGHNDNTQRIQVFPSEVALSKYTKRTGFIFPRYGVEDGTILWTLLRRIEDPPPVGTRRNEHNQIIGESVPGAAAEPSEKKGSPKKKRGARSKKGSRRTDSSDVPVNSPENGGQP